MTLSLPDRVTRCEFALRCVVFRDDEAARAGYVEALERKAARTERLEVRIRELEDELRELRAGAPPPPPLDVTVADIYVDARLEAYVAALVRATDPARTEGIVSGATRADHAALVHLARTFARDGGRRHAMPQDIQRAARQHLPSRIILQDPRRDARSLVAAILSIVDVP